MRAVNANGCREWSAVSATPKNEYYWIKIGKIGNYCQLSIGDAFIGDFVSFEFTLMPTGRAC